MIVIKLRILFLLFILSLWSCKSPKNPSLKDSTTDHYTIIETKKYEDGNLFYKTIESENLPSKENFSYSSINKHNVRYNSVTEYERHIDFDTIFNEKQRNEIDIRLKSFRSVKLKKNKFSNPSILSKKIRKESGKGLERVTFPFVVKDDKGNSYGFIYRDSSMGILFIYKKVDEKWKELARLEIWI